MWRGLARACLTAVLVASLALTGITVLRIGRDPQLRALVAAGNARIEAAVARDMARAATPERISARLDALAAETPRNWLAIEALLAVLADRGAAPAAGTAQRLDLARAEDAAPLARTGRCLRCAYDAASCAISEVAICNLPLALTPAGDLIDLTRESATYLAGGDADEVVLILSAVGLAASALVVASGGGSGLVKFGAATAKTARRMNLLSQRLTGLLTDAARRGIDWAAVARARAPGDLAAALRPQVVAPVAATLGDLGRVGDRLGLPATMQLLPLIDGPQDAAALARAADALGTRTLAAAEVLGKSRLFRLTLRWSETAWQLVAGLLGLLWSLVAMVTQAMATLSLRGLRRAAHSTAPRHPPARPPRPLPPAPGPRKSGRGGPGPRH